ncbi:hypothetical protein ABK040_005833 [Willaertia magna]
MDKLFHFTSQELSTNTFNQFKKHLFKTFNLNNNSQEKSSIALQLELVILPSTNTLTIFPPTHEGENILWNEQVLVLWRKRILCFYYLYSLECFYPIITQLIFYIKSILFNTKLNSYYYSKDDNSNINIGGWYFSYPYERKRWMKMEMYLLLRFIQMSKVLSEEMNTIISLAKTSVNKSSNSDIQNLSNNTNQHLSPNKLNNISIDVFQDWLTNQVLRISNLNLENETLESIFTQSDKVIDNFINQLIINFQQQPMNQTSMPILFYNKLIEFKENYEFIYSLKGIKKHILYPSILKKNIDINNTLSRTLWLINNNYIGNTVQQKGNKNSLFLNGLSYGELLDLSPVHFVFEEALQSANINNKENNNTHEMKENQEENHLGEDFDNTHLFHLHDLNNKELMKEQINDRNKGEMEREMNDLFSKAFKQQLQPVQITELSENMDKVTMFKELLTPIKLPDLVKNNKDLAIKCLQILIRTNNRRLYEFITVLISIPVSLQSLEVVNHLVKDEDTRVLFTSNIADDEPPFLHSFIRNCINNCSQIKEQTSQMRKVRLVCVFIQSLIRNEIFIANSGEDIIIIELKQFCLDFVKVKEAVDLFQLMKKVNFIT